MPKGDELYRWGEQLVVFLWNLTCFQMPLGHSLEASAKYRVETFDQSKHNVLQHSEEYREPAPEVPKAFGDAGVGPVQDPLGVLAISSAAGCGSTDFDIPVVSEHIF
jgi:hypothetical protein